MDSCKGFREIAVQAVNFGYVEVHTSAAELMLATLCPALSNTSLADPCSPPM